MKNSFLYALSIIVIGTMFSCNDKKENETVVTEFETIEFLEPPIKDVTIPLETFLVNPQKDTILYDQKGTLIKIPKNAFLDAKGKVVSEPVNVTFRSFSNPLETYIAGIPMTFTNEKGEEMVFESAGMFEINAQLAEENVFVNPENKIEVTLSSFTDDTNFNTYDLNPETNEWVKTGKDKIISTTKEEALKNAPKMPEPPKKAGKFAFKIEDIYNQINSLKEFENVWFEPLDGKAVGFDSKDIIVKDLNNGTYEVTFIPWGKSSEKIRDKAICVLAFNDEASYSKAMELYQKKYAHAIKKAKIERDRIEREWTNYEIQRRRYYLFMENEKFQKLNLKNRILRTLEVNLFGFVNCDLPINYPQGAKVKASFIDSNGTAIVLKNIVLIEKGRNALFRYKDEIQYNPSKENILWGITQDEKLAYFTSEDFKSLENSSDKSLFKMRVHPNKLTSYEEIMAVLFPE